MTKDEKLTLESFTIEWTSWKETDSVTECVLIVESLVRDYFFFCFIQLNV